MTNTLSCKCKKILLINSWESITWLYELLSLSVSETRFWSQERVWSGWPLRTLTHLSTSDVIWMEDVVVVVRSGEHSVTVSTEFRATSCQPCERGHRCFTSRFNPPSVLSFRLVTGKQGWMGFLLLTRPVWLWSATQPLIWPFEHALCTRPNNIWMLFIKS